MGRTTGGTGERVVSNLLDPLGLFTPSDSAADLAEESAEIVKNLIATGFLTDQRAGQQSWDYRTIAGQLDQQNEGLNMLREASRHYGDLASGRGELAGLAELESERLRARALRDIAGQASAQSRGTFNPAIARAAINAQGSAAAEIDRETRAAAQRERLQALQGYTQLGALQAQERLARERLLQQERQQMAQRQLAQMAAVAGFGNQAITLEQGSGLDSALGAGLGAIGSLFGGGGQKTASK